MADQTTSTPYIDETTDPGNPIFRFELNKDMRYSFSFRQVSPERREQLASFIGHAISEAYTAGSVDARAQVRKAIREALTL